MNARMAKDEVTLLFPTNMSYATPVQTAPAGALRGFGRSVAQALAWLVEFPRRRAVMAELETMSERELADIGLSRADLPRVFDAEFAAARSASSAKAGAAGMATSR